MLVAGARVDAAPITVGGITFPDGPSSFADAVVSYTPGANVTTPGDYDDPADALGLPNYNGATGSVSLGQFGTLVLRFVDNSLTTSGNATPDLHVFEIGGAVEVFNLSISTDGVTWIDLGDVLGQPTSVDIDGKAGVVAGAQYSYVRLIDVLPHQSGAPFGEADIDAVGAISSAPPVDPVPEPLSMTLVASGICAVALRRRLRNRP